MIVELGESWPRATKITKQWHLNISDQIALAPKTSVPKIPKPLKNRTHIYSRLSRRNTSRGSSTGLVTVGPTKV